MNLFYVPPITSTACSVLIHSRCSKIPVAPARHSTYIATDICVRAWSRLVMYHAAIARQVRAAMPNSVDRMLLHWMIISNRIGDMRRKTWYWRLQCVAHGFGLGDPFVGGRLCEANAVVAVHTQLPRLHISRRVNAPDPSISYKWKMKRYGACIAVVPRSNRTPPHNKRDLAIICNRSSVIWSIRVFRALCMDTIAPIGLRWCS